jgi:hypothetical protein
VKLSLGWPRIWIIAGLILMIIGAIDPLEGSVVILAGSLAAAIGAFFAKSRRKKLLITALVLIAAGVGAMFAMSAMGGIGGRTGRSLWWALILLPYPAGWIMGLIGAVLSLKEFIRVKG